MKRDTGNKFTFRRMVGFFWAIIYLTTLIMYIVSQTVAMRQATGNIENGIKLGVSASEEAIENSLEMIDMYLYENYYLNSPTSISGLCYTYLYNEDRTESQAALQTLSKLVQSIPSWTGNVSFDMMYITGGEKSIWLDAGEAGSYQVRNALKKVIEEHNISSSEDVVKRYMVYESEGRQYLLRVMKLDRCYFVIGLSENAILSLLDNAKYTKDSICFAADADGNVIFSSAPIQGCLYPVNDGKYINDGGKTYLQAGYQSNITGYYFGILTDKVSISHELFGTKVLFGMVILITTILFLVSRLFVGRFIEKPITYGIRTMHEIEQGDFERSIDVNSREDRTFICILFSQAIQGEGQHDSPRVQAEWERDYRSEVAGSATPLTA